jgi:hypothetical protein
MPIPNVTLNGRPPEKGGFMRTAILAIVCMVSISFAGTAQAQTIEMAGKCDELQKKLAELIKKPDSTDAQKIKEALGVDILDSCAATEGQITCYQCVDKDGSLRALQLLQKRDTKRFELLGFGCKCTEKK